MAAFAGIVTFDGAPGDKISDRQIGAALTGIRNGQIRVHRNDGALLAERGDVPARGAAARLVLDAGRRNLFAALASLDNREELRVQLGIAPSELAGLSDGDIVLRMFERWGEAGIARCLGAFCFAHWNAAERRLILGRDCLGRRALFFYRGRDFVAFATTLRALQALPGVPCELDDIVLAKFLALNLNESRRTFYRGLERVAGRTMVTIDRIGIAHRHYWSPELDAPPPYNRKQDYIERARELLDQSVEAAIADTPRVAISASGGLDSSAIAATAARLGRAERITCYTLVPQAGTQLDVGPQVYWDETDKMQALKRMHPGLEINFIAPDRPHPYEEDATRYFARSTLPSLNPSNLGWFNNLYDAAMAAGHSVLLNGNRGNLGLTWRGSLSLVALLRAGRWGGFARELPALARESGRSLPRTFASEALKPGGPAWMQSLLYRLFVGDPRSVAHYSALNPEFIAQSDLVRIWQAEGFVEPWFRATGRDAARFRARYLFDRNQFSRDSYAMMAEQQGFEAREPHGDRRLLEFLLKVPEPMYRENGIPRSFARAVLADRLPPEILNERRSGAQSGLWFGRLDARRGEIAAEIEHLEASPLARRLLDLPRLKKLMAEWPKDNHAAEPRQRDFHLALDRGIHVGRFIRWVEGGNG